MAMIDYGVIAKKNGRILTTDFFTDMKDALGFSIEKSDCGEPIEGNYFTYLGDRDFYVGIYKGMLSFFSGNKFIGGNYKPKVVCEKIEYTNKIFNNWFIFPYKDYTYTIYVPNNTILNNYNIDLE